MNSICDDFRNLLKETNAYDDKRRFVNFDHLWYEPKNLKTSTDLIYNFIWREFQHLIPEDRLRLVILSPDHVKSDFGIIPISVLVAHRIGCRFGVWKEFASIKWGTSAIIGTKEPDLVCIVLQHVVQNGATAVRIAHAISEMALDWKFQAFVAAVFKPEEGENLKDSLAEVANLLHFKPEFKYVVSTNDLK